MKNRIKTIVSLLMVMTLIMANLTGCGKNKAKASEKISVVTTIFPEYDWVKNIVKDNTKVDITMLLDKGVDLHSYQPTADDILKISTCDMFIYVGGESDEWVEDVLDKATNKNMKVINLMEILGESVKEEEMKEGMQEDEHEHEHEDADEEEHEHEDADEEEHEHNHEDADEENHEHEHEEIEYDEHVWLSLKNAEIISKKISEEMGKIDSKNKDKYEKNCEEYVAKLKQLDEKYEQVCKDAKVKTLLFGDRFPFRYMVDDYNLDYYAAFVGCSAESEASFETIKFLADKVDELNLKTILQIESADGKIANTIKKTTKAKDMEILTMNSMQATTSKDVKNGDNYIGIMESNLEVLKKALD